MRRDFPTAKTICGSTGFPDSRRHRRWRALKETRADARLQWRGVPGLGSDWRHRSCGVPPGSVLISSIRVRRSLRASWIRPARESAAPPAGQGPALPAEAPMAAVGRRGVEASARVLRGAWGLLGVRRGFRSSAASEKCHAARVRPRKGNQPVSYEEAHPPHHIAHRKGWLSLHTGNLNGETDAAERTVEDVFIRKFLFGTFHGCLADEIVLKRRANTLIICAILMQNLPPHKIYFLVGYTEVLLSFFYKCPVKMEVQTISEKIIYKCL